MVLDAKFGYQPDTTRLLADFDWTDVAGGSVVLGTVKGRFVIAEAVVIIDYPFDGGLQITVGDAIAQGRIMTASENMPSVAARYKKDTDLEYLDTTELLVFFPSGTPTTGSGRVIVYLE